MKCNRCGAEQIKSGIFLVCSNTECINNPSSRKAAEDRSITMAEFERDDDESGCQDCDCADPTTDPNLAAECDCECHSPA